MAVGSIIRDRFAAIGIITPSAVAENTKKYLPPGANQAPDTKY
jgi:hypothetical protein